MRYALLVEYDGTLFHGSQLQRHERTVQGELETALEKICGVHFRVRLAGRTDAGVHAIGQVAVFDSEDRHSPLTIREALNFHLPDDVAVKAVEPVADEFDPRRRALRREYVFNLNDGFVRSPLGRWTEVRIKDRLDEAEMQIAAKCLVGSHDFASFAGPATPVDATTIRRVDSVDVVRGEGRRLTIKVIGNAFLHQQVRRMAGALVRVGAGKLNKTELAGLVETPVRGSAGWPLSPEGLCLARIEYGKGGPFQAETEYN
jgi:tRNA pseudouridine38-40 synthase